MDDCFGYCHICDDYTPHIIDSTAITAHIHCLNCDYVFNSETKLEIDENGIQEVFTFKMSFSFDLKLPPL